MPKVNLMNEDNNSEDLSPEMLDNVPLAKARFDWLLRRLRSSDYAALPE
jgi:CRP/FNR family cyclic AMP-dependent transcriptional regulator